MSTESDAARSGGPGITAGRDLDNPLWQFSLAVYGMPGVADECLALQATLELDVNVLLFCAWLGARHGAALKDQEILNIEQVSRQWHLNVVRPLRAVRQILKTMPSAAEGAAKTLRADVARDELLAEQIEQNLLFRSAETTLKGAAPAAPAEAVRSNVAAFVRLSAKASTITEPPAAERLLAAAIGYRSDR